MSRQQTVTTTFEFYPYATTQFSGTVQKTYHNFSAHKDAEALKKAFEGKGCDTRAVMQILCQRSNYERQEIRREYEAHYKRDLAKDLIDELKGKFEDVIIALLFKPEDYDARELHHAVEKMNTDEHVFIEILCTRTNREIRSIREAYQKTYGKDLESVIAGATGGKFKNLLIALCHASREESWFIDTVKAQTQVRALATEGEKQWGNEGSEFIKTFVNSNFAHLQQVFREFEKYTEHTIEYAIEKAFTGDAKEGFLAIVKSAKNMPAYFAELLYKSMKGLGTSDRQLIRVIVSRSEKDLKQIKEQFQKLYNKPLQHMIEGDTSGDYKDALLLLVREA